MRFDGPRALRALINHEPIVRCLGAHDVLSAKLIEQAGVESIFVGGFGCSASLLGLPDINMVTLTNMTDAARRITQSVHLPVVVDGDTGHGDLPHVQRTVQLFEQIGAAGILLEDQVMPKRCGHFDGKMVIDMREMTLKIHAACEVRENPDVILIARTDARASHGLDEAVRRACVYGEAGADIVYVEAPASVDELGEIARRVPFPLMANMLTGGKTPAVSVDELKELGYKIVLWPIETVLTTAHIVQKLARTLIEHGRVDAMAHEMVSFGDIQNLLGLPNIMDVRARIEKRAHEATEPKTT